MDLSLYSGRHHRIAGDYGMVRAMDQALSITGRFAPSPTGLLHLGHAFSALTAHFTARSAGGRFLVRLEDIDQGRCRPEFAAAILHDLAWLGIDWDGPVRRQSDHFDDYRAALDRLAAMDLLYPCFCTRKEVEAEIARSGHAPHGPDGVLYPGLCRTLSTAQRAEYAASGRPYALRLNMGRAAEQAGVLTWQDHAAGVVAARPLVFGDVVLARKDSPTSYHLAVTVDDALQGVTLVTRGRDLFHATHVHRLLQALLDLPSPAYHHHELVVDEYGKRFAKRDKALTLAALRESGRSPDELRKMAGFRKGLP